MTDEMLYTPEELAQKLKLSKYTIYEMIKRGDIQAHHIGRSIRVSQTQLDLYIMGTRKAENVFEAVIEQDGPDQYAAVGTVKFAVSTPLTGAVKISIRPEDVILSAGTFTSSARNMLKGTVTGVATDEHTAKVCLSIGDIILMAQITHRSLEEMDIRRGDELFAVFKAMAVRVIRAQ